MSNNPHVHPSWSDLSCEILELILNLLDFGDHVRFGAVCKSWRRITANSRHFQALLFPWMVFHRSKTSNTWAFFSPMEGRIYHRNLPLTRGWKCLGCSRGWLMMTHITSGNYLLNPFTNQRIQLPDSTIYGDTEGFNTAILSLCPSFGNRAAERCILVAVHGSCQLVFCRPGDTEWSTFGSTWGEKMSIVDIIFFNGLLYGVTLNHQVAVFEFDSQPICKSAYLMMDGVGKYAGSFAQSLCLVESKGELLMVIKFWAQVPNHIDGHPTLLPIQLGIYKLNLCVPRWEKVRTLGDEMLLLSERRSQSVNSENFSGFGFRRNCIYFTDGWNANYDLREFCLEDEKIRNFIPDGYPSMDSPFHWLLLDA